MIDAAATKEPAASRVDSCPQAIFKFHHPSSLDYRARHVLPVKAESIMSTAISAGIYRTLWVSLAEIIVCLQGVPAKQGHVFDLLRNQNDGLKRIESHLCIISFNLLVGNILSKFIWFAF